MIKSFNYICGPSGSGKSHETISMILRSLRSGKRAFLIVPEQEVMVAERRLPKPPPTLFRLSPARS